MIQDLNKLKAHQTSVAIIGLGYVGLPLLLEISRLYKVVGYDIDQSLIVRLTERLTDNDNIHVTSDQGDLKQCSIYLICVPTDIMEDKTPDLSDLIAASNTVADVIVKGDIVIFESTVYPGCTEEVCIPIIESMSGLKLNKEFTVGYAPERIVPGDPSRDINNIPRIISSSNSEGAEIIYNFYKSFVGAAIHIAPSIKVAEAAKMVENIQRDLNISLMNELAIIFDKLDIDTESVLTAAATKWNFHSYEPGLVGGHCISVDPFYLLHKSRSLGIEPKVIAAGREINEFLPFYIAEKIESFLNQNNKKSEGSRILVYGVTFKENVDDVRNSKVLDLIRYLQEKKAQVHVIDPLVSPESLKSQNISLIDQPSGKHKYDVVILAVKHKSFLSLGHEHFYNLLDKHKTLFDLKRIIPQAHREKFEYWAL